MNRPEKVRIPREDFEAWLDLMPTKYGGLTPKRSRSAARVIVQLTDTVEGWLNVTLLEQKPDGFYFCWNLSDYTHVRVETYHGSAFSYKGKGSRGPERAEVAMEYLELLTGHFAGI